MSEQEKNNAVEAEGTVTETRKENIFRRAWNNIKVRKALKVIGRVAEGAFIGLVGFTAGRKSALKPIPVEGNLEAPEEENDAE